MKKDLNIIGLTCHYTGNHDNSVALLTNGKIVFAESEERISRIKHDTQFPIRVIKHALAFNKIDLKEVDYFVSASPPTNLLKLLSNYFVGFKHTDIQSIIKWIMGRTLLLFSQSKSNSKKSLPENYQEANLPTKKLKFVSHYLAHAETAYTFSGIEECLVVSWDGYGLSEMGEPLCGVIYYGKGGELKLLEEIPVYSSLALYYGAVTVALGFKLNDGEGKTMGLAAYGRESDAVDEIRKLFPCFSGKSWVVRSSWLEVNGVSRPEYFKKTDFYKKIESLIKRYGWEQIAYASQKVLEEEGEKFFRYLVKRYKQKKVALAGGIFLNVKFNMRLLTQKIVDEIFVYPNPSDGGVAVGAAIVAYKSMGRKILVEKMKSAGLGCSFGDSEIRASFDKFMSKIKINKIESKLPKIVALHISEGKVVGWFQGRGEWGPRALGTRSVLADPRKIDTKERINKYLKQRDWFMPFAPVILDEYKDEVLKHGYGTAFMTLTDDVNSKFLKKIPAAIHIDGTARSQIIEKSTNPLYWQVVEEFRKITGVPVLLNTSFNRHGLPIVHTPFEAIRHLIWGCVDELAIGNYLISLRK